MSTEFLVTTMLLKCDTMLTNHYLFEGHFRKALLSILCKIVNIVRITLTCCSLGCSTGGQWCGDFSALEEIKLKGRCFPVTCLPVSTDICTASRPFHFVVTLRYFWYAKGCSSLILLLNFYPEKWPSFDACIVEFETLINHKKTRMLWKTCSCLAIDTAHDFELPFLLPLKDIFILLFVLLRIIWPRDLSWSGRRNNRYETNSTKSIK